MFFTSAVPRAVFAIRGFFAASVCREEIKFGRMSVVAFRLSFGLRYAKAGRQKKREGTERESGRWTLNVER